MGKKSRNNFIFYVVIKYTLEYHLVIVRAWKIKYIIEKYI